MYFRSQKISNQALIGLAIVAIATLAVVQWYPLDSVAREQRLMLAASEQTDAAFHAVQCRRLELGHKMLASQDPSGSGMLGPSMSLVTTLPGHLDAKQTSVNPNFAAVVVKYLSQTGAQPGDYVAIGCTGSFPALNIAAITACETMGLKPVMVSSAASSQFGANHPDLMWPDMESLLHDEGLITTRSSAVSRGGFLDKAAGMTKDTRQLLDAAIARSGLPMLADGSIERAIESRMQIFSQAAADHRYAAYINVGGGYASVGGTEGNEMLGSGVISPSEMNGAIAGDSVATRFLNQGVPVINLTNVLAIARQNGLPIAPQQRPAVGQGGVYVVQGARQPLAIAGILLIVGLTSMVVRPPTWLTLWWTRSGWQTDKNAQPQWMV
jgi:poly-gamma-glutamate system protein